MRNSYGFLALVVCLSVGASASAQGREHDGFMLRLTGGFGYAALTSEVGPSEFKLDGVAGNFAVDVGGAPVENLNIHGRLSLLSVAAPTASIDGEELGSNDEASMMMVLFGAGLTYYIMPANFYLTGVFGAALAGIAYEDASGDQESGGTDWGPGFNLDAGWEFWVGQSWGLGPALRFTYISVPDDIDVEDPPVWNGLGFSVLFSGTFQ